VPYCNLPDLFRWVEFGGCGVKYNPPRFKLKGIKPLYEQVKEGANIVIVGHSLGKAFIAIEKLVPGISWPCAITAIIDLSVLHGKVKLATFLEHLEIGQDVE
jgi:hypothetical protein